MTMMDIRPAVPVAPPERATHTMHELNHTGDSEITWDPSNPVEVGVARDAFDKFRRRGFMLYRTDGDTSEQMHTFDPNARRIIAMPALVGG